MEQEISETHTLEVDKKISQVAELLKISSPAQVETGYSGNFTPLAEDLPSTQFQNYLEIEADAIKRAASQLQLEQVNSAIELLITSQGKAVLLGVGKSGLVAHKIAATLTSTGTLAVCLHPSDALHGDLGVIAAEDVVVVLSNSGETDELIAILPYLKHRQVPIIAIVGNLRSTLSLSADVVLDATVDREACPFNLAPTASTTVALAVGDALALTLMQVKGLTPQDFALNHPAGRLGKRLTLRVRDLMYSGLQNPTVSPEATWIDVLNTINQGGIGAVNVVDGLGHLMGIITDGDLRRLLQRIELTKLEALRASSMMTQNPVIVSPDLLAYNALQLMENRSSQISVLSVVDQQQHCVGMIRLHDIIRSGLQ